MNISSLEITLNFMVFAVAIASMMFIFANRNNDKKNYGIVIFSFMIIQLVIHVILLIIAIQNNVGIAFRLVIACLFSLFVIAFIIVCIVDKIKEKNK